MHGSDAGLIPLWLKLLYTVFLAVLVPRYWRSFGPTNFLYFCDAALFLAFGALWWESPLLASTPAVGILLPQALWILDLCVRLCGYRLVGMTEYMFRPSLSIYSRFLSLFHFWLPLLLLWLVCRLGYDDRAFWCWTVLAWVLMLTCYLIVPPPPAPADQPNLPVNVNFVYGPADDHPQTWLPPLVYFVLLMIGLPLLVFWPTHLLLRMLCPRAG